MASTPVRPRSTDDRLSAGRDQWSLTLALVILCVFLVTTLTRPDLQRPFEWDELSTLRYFTWAGVQGDGEPRDLSRLEDIRALERPALREMLIGLYCSVGRWPEPGNHVVNSLLADLALVVFSPPELAIRMPAVLGALVFGFLLFWLWDRVLLWKRTSLLALMLALSSPFVWSFSRMGRGYTWMLALQVLLLILLLRFAERPRSIWLGSLAVLVSTLSFMNVLTTALYWLMPVYLGFLLVTPDSRGHSGSLHEPYRSRFRRGLVIQLLCLGALGTLFVLDRLPYIYSTSIQAGNAFGSLSGMTGLLGNIFHSLFPTPAWKLVAAVGLAGFLLTPRHSAQRTLAWVGLMAVGLQVTDFLIAGRVPVSRVCALVLPMILLSISGLLERLLRALGPGRARQSVWGLALLATLALVGLTPHTSLEDATATRFMQRLDELPERQDVATVVLRERHVPMPVTLYYPDDWQPVEETVAATGPTRLLLVLRDDGSSAEAVALSGRDFERQLWQPDEWPAHEIAAVGERFRALEILGTTSKLSSTLHPDRALVLWYPAYPSVTVSPRRVLDHLAAHEIRFLPIGIRYQAKLEVFGRLGVVALPADSPAEFDRVRRAVENGLVELGGDAVMFIPHTQETASTHRSAP